MADKKKKSRLARFLGRRGADSTALTTEPPDTAPSASDAQDDLALLEQEGADDLVVSESGLAGLASVRREAQRARKKQHSRTAFLCDASGSMAGLWEECLKWCLKLVERAAETNSQMEMMWARYRDYCDGIASMFECTEWTNNHRVLHRFIEETRCVGGGSNACEAVENALRMVADMSEVSRIILIGDEPPYPSKRSVARAIQDRGLMGIRPTDYRVQARQLRKLGRPVYAFPFPEHYPETVVPTFTEIAEITGGKVFPLEQYNDLLDIWGMAISHDEGGAQAVLDYVRRYQPQLTASGEQFKQMLIEGDK